MLLAGDIGGTKTVLSLFSADKGPHTPLAQKTFSSTHYPSLERMIREFTQTVAAPIENACFAVAGPVFAGRAQITNLPWIIDAAQLQSAFGWSSVFLINDLEAVAYAIPILEPSDVHTLSAGNPAPGGNLSVVAPGTGLGEAYLTCVDGRYLAHASEGSHTSFAPLNALEIGLLQYLFEKGFEHVSYERVCSGGLGIPLLYADLKDTGYAEEPAWLTERLAASEDPTPIIMATALDQATSCILCQATLDLFVAILGSECGNHALKIMATGGIYLGGGIPPRILSKLEEPAFLNALRHKGRFKAMLSNFPVKVILNAQAGLIGAAAFGFDHSPVMA
ncbi:MAG: glucokinase [Anaerolineales bacterium]|nr:glucokinase [Anaerolineales bacterium]